MDQTSEITNEALKWTKPRRPQEVVGCGNVPAVPSSVPDQALFTTPAHRKEESEQVR